MQHTWSVENYKRSHAGERIWWFIGIICFCVKATGTAHTKLIHLLLLVTIVFRIDFVVDWYFYQRWFNMALQDKAYCIFSAFLRLPNSKSDVTILANSPVISLVVVPAFGDLWQAGNAWSGVSLIWHVSLPSPPSFWNQGWSSTQQ